MCLIFAKRHDYKPLIRVKGSRSHLVRPQSRGSKVEDTRNSNSEEKQMLEDKDFTFPQIKLNAISSER